MPLGLRTSESRRPPSRSYFILELHPSMRAIQLQRLHSEPELVEIPTPTPGPGEVLLRVDAAGLCPRDLHMRGWPVQPLPYKLPFTLGHETAGTVAGLGLGARGASEGDRVAVYARWGCGRCSPC